MLVHICCSVDSHYFLSELQKAYPNEELIGFFYNPNIHPKAEYDLRLLDVRRSCEMLGIKLMEGEYNPPKWYEKAKFYEDAPEKGDRCDVCFVVRLRESAKLAKQIGEQSFTTTLLSSPMKEQKILFGLGSEIGEEYGLEFIRIDVRSNGGTQKQNELSKKDNLYRQNYCGCEFALRQQRQKQNRFPLEFISPLHQQVMAGSIEHRNLAFSKRDCLEAQSKNYLLLQQEQRVWRCLFAKLECFNEVIPSYILVNSQSKKPTRLGALFWVKPKKLNLRLGEIGYSKRDSSIVLTLQAFNEIVHSHYRNLSELQQSPLSYEEELSLRAKITSPQSLSPIFVIESKILEDVRIEVQSIFQDEKVFEVIEV